MCDQFVGVLDVAFVDGVPGIVGDVVQFVRVAGVCAFWFAVGSWLDTFESGSMFGLLGVYGCSGGGWSFAFVVKVSGGDAVFVEDLLFGM